MKINKKFALATAGLLTMSAIGTLTLTSCSQGANPNTTSQYYLNFGGNEYWINRSGQLEQKVDGKWVTPSPIDWAKYNIKKYNSSDDKTFPKVADQQARANEAVATIVSQYIINTINQYLYLITSVAAMDKDTFNALNPVQKEFVTAYHLGVGEGTDTYRLRINSVDITMGQVLQSGWNYGTPVADSELEKDAEGNVTKVNTPKQDIQVTGIKLKFGYYRATGGSGIEDVNNIKTIQNTNWKSYWKNYLDASFTGPTTLEFNYTIPTALNLSVSPGVIGYYPDKTEANPNPKATYAYSGQVIINGFDKNNTNSPLNWPLWWTGLKYWGQPLNAEGKVENASAPSAEQTVSNAYTQIACNQNASEDLNQFYENNITYKDIMNKDNKESNNKYSVVYNSLNTSFALTNVAAAPAPSSRSSH